MIKRILNALVVFALPGFLMAQDVVLKKGMKLTRSARVKKMEYKLKAAAGALPVIMVEGDNVVIDFNHAILRGNKEADLPDQFAGIGVLVQNSKNVTIKNLNAHGYKVAIKAINVDSLHLENCDLSYNYRPRLNSTQEKEDLSDWMSYHNNENDEWLRFGSAIYLKDCNNFFISECKVTGGQNGLMMTNCNKGYIYNNDFSFNSGIGIGMYRSSGNSILHNRLIFNVRGYSHGVYNRGQDSAGILVYEQSHNNLFKGNNVTHGGDGFFLWAGQHTMNTGEGGCNGNVITGNDFSYAPTNGIEVTFSSNEITGNRIFGCDHGIWGGYSYETKISGNQFRRNRIAIAIEHGQNNEIRNNLFVEDKEAIRLWSRKEQPADWKYAEKRDTRSVLYKITGNSFNNNPLVFNLSRTDSLFIFNNTYSSGVSEIFRLDTSVTYLDTAVQYELFELLRDDRDPNAFQVQNPMDPFRGSGKLSGRDKIMITEWGPYDFRYPLIWLTNPVEKTDTLRFQILGPMGKWTILSSKGLKWLSKKSGSFPDSLMAVRLNTNSADIHIRLQYSGAAGYTNQLGKKVPKGKPSVFSFYKYFQPIDWEVLFYSLDTAGHNPITTGRLFSMYERKAPVMIDTVDRLQYAWWGGIRVGETRYPQFITVASGQVEVPKGNYEMSLTWDDAVRVYLDDSLVVDEWNPARYKFDESPHRKIRLQLGGSHRFRVEHLELGGFAALAFRLRRVK